MPSYNRFECIEQAIVSVTSQDYQNKELIIIDGQSTDGTLDIIRKFAQMYPYIHWISEIDEGVYDAMNKGVGLSRGEWVYFLGTDDSMYDADVISRTLSSAEVDSQVIYGNVSSGKYGPRYDGEFDWEKILRKNICHQAIFYRRKLFDSLGGFALQYGVVADWEFNLRWMFNTAIKRKYVDIVVANFADGGLSSVNPVDSVFANDFSQLILKYGRNTLSSRVLVHYLSKASVELIERRQWMKSLDLLLENVFLLRRHSMRFMMLYIKHLLRFVFNGIKARI